MDIMITGSKGLLGSSIIKVLERNNPSLKDKIRIIPVDRPEYNIASYNSLKNLFKQYDKLRFVINCAAYTNVDKAEEEKKKAYRVNASALGVLSSLCLENNAHLIHFSTEFIFDGKKLNPYVEKDIPNPLNYYGQTKLDGENIIKKRLGEDKLYTIFRLQWLFGDNPKTFFMRILEIAKEGNVKIVDDEYGSPCSVDFVSNILYKCLTHERFRQLRGRTFHLTHNDYCSRYECGKYFLDKMGVDTQVFPFTNYSYGADRPKWGVMRNTRLSNALKTDLGSWKKDIDDFVKYLKGRNV